jgi:glutathione synthase/RimK-type ligase-like ATP-grasp enzyme
MKGKVLGVRQAKFTGQAIAESLGAFYGTEIHYNEPQYDYIFRYGNATGVRITPHVMINNAIAITKASDKVATRLLLHRAMIPVPRLYDEEDVVDNREQINEGNLTLIARPYKHYKGRNFNLVYDLDSAMQYLDKGYYLQQVIDKDTEYRIFIWRDEIFETNIKEPREYVKSDLIRNLDNGWYFRPTRWRNVPDDLKGYSKQAVQLTGLHFGAVDCCVDKGGNPYLFEVNSAPALFERKIDKLASKIKDYLSTRIGE